MAKQKSIIPLSGKLDDEVFVKAKYGNLVHKAPKNSNKGYESALKQQYNRTGFLNALAGELNKVIGSYSDKLKPRNFYQCLQKRFRKEPLNNRFMLLKQLEGMEVNPKYTLAKLGDARLAVRATEKKITVELNVLFHPGEYVGRYKINCYTYEVSLLCWKKEARESLHVRQFSEWIYITDGLPAFEFHFNRPAGTVHWLVCLKQQAGVNEQPIPSFMSEGMQIALAGSFDKKDLALYNKRKEEETAQAAKDAEKKAQEQIVRVKAKTKRML